MDENKIIAAILTGPIVTKLADESSDIPPGVAVSIYEEVLDELKKRDARVKD